MPVREYTHMPIGEEVDAIAGHYIIDKEYKLKLGEREALIVLGSAMIDKACCGTGGCRYALVPGYLVEEHVRTNDNGEAVSEVELVADEGERKEIEKLIRAAEYVQQVNFW